MNTWQATAKLIKNRPWLYLVNAIIWGILHSSHLLPGWLTQQAFDRMTGETAAGLNLWTLVALLVAVGIGRFGNLYLGLTTYVPFRAYISGTLRLNMMQHILRRPGANALPGSPGEAVSRFRGDVERVMFLVGDWLVDTPGFVFGAVLGLIVLFRVDSRVTLAVVIPAAIVFAASNLARKRLEYYRAQERAAAGRVTGFIGEMYGAVQAVKVADGFRGLGQRFAQLNEARREAALKDSLFLELLRTSFFSTIEISTGLILLLAGQVMASGEFSVGDFALFVAYLFPITDGLMTVGELMAKQKQVDVSIGRMESLMQDAPPGALVANTPIHLHGRFPAIKAPLRRETDRLHSLIVRDLTYHFPDSSGAHKGITDISLDLKRGDFVVITGRIGSGKSTLLRVLLGLLPQDGGEIRWNGTLVEKRDDFFVPPRAAYTPQVPRLFSDTLQQNILMGLPENQANVPQAIHAAVMDKDLLDLDDGLLTKVGPRGVRLSGGQMQRTAAARMFARRPALYVFDDLSSALDVETEKQLWQRLPGMHTNTTPDAALPLDTPTCLVVSHRRAALRRASHIIVLENGRIADEGTLSELLTRSSELQELWQGEAVEGGR